VKRPEFIALIGGAAVTWPITAHAQQPTMPVVGFLDTTSPDTSADRLRAFREGFKDTGYVEGENVVIEYRWGENQIDRMPTLAAELVRRRVAVIAAGAPASTFAAKAATTTIPIVFMVAEDPVRLGIVESLARPGSNLTGINFFSAELAAKRLEFLRELVPAATRVAVLVSPTNAETPILRVGGPCVRCATGKLAPTIKIPDLRRPGFSKVFWNARAAK
jgi:putative tryptophan/tyrosine transport system substrate-binding protein